MIKKGVLNEDDMEGRRNTLNEVGGLTIEEGEIEVEMK